MNYQLPNDISHDRIWFTADLHLMHRRIIEICHRPFVDLGDMHAQLVDNFNQNVGDGDHTFIIGDTFLLKRQDRDAIQQIVSIIGSLNGYLHFVIGNHDDRQSLETVIAAVNAPYGKQPKIDPVIYDRCTLSVCDPDAFNGRRKIVLDHYPMRAWDGAHRGSWHLYGHVHACDKFVSTDADFGYATDVGIDACQYHPVNYTEIKKLFATYDSNPKLGTNQSVWLPNSPSQA